MIVAQVAVQGVTPGMLMHKFAEATWPGLKPVLGGSKKPAPEDEAELGAYRLETGELCIPAHNLFESFCAAATDHQVAGKGKTTYKNYVKGGVLVEPQYVVLTDSSGAPLTQYEIDQRPVRIQRARIVRARPLLRFWQARFTVNILDDEMVPLSIMNSIVVRAGQTKGIGDYRPVYGRFVVTEFRQV